MCQGKVKQLVRLTRTEETVQNEFGQMVVRVIPVLRTVDTQCCAESIHERVHCVVDLVIYSAPALAIFKVVSFFFIFSE